MAYNQTEGSWDDSAIPVPSLHPIRPQSLNSAICESIHSFVGRMAFHYSITRNQFLRELRPCLMGAARNPRTAQVFPSRLSPGWEHMVLAELLARATGVYEVILCTIANLIRSLFIHTARPGRICLLCSRLAPPGEAWDPLIYQFAFVGSCPFHRSRLITPVCPAPDPLPNRCRPDVPGVCSTCGSIGYRCLGDGFEVASEAEHYVATQVGESIAAMTDVNCHIDKRSIQRGIGLLHDIADEQARLRARSWPHSINAHESSWKWPTKIDLFTLLSICAKLQVSLSHALMGNLVAAPAPTLPAYLRFIGLNA
jgi:hypothetical protein